MVRSNSVKVRAAIGTAIVVFGASTGLAAEPEQSPAVAAVIGCRDQADPQVRLRCYDAAAGALATATASGSIVLVDRGDIRKTRRSLFGFSVPKVPFFSGDKSQDEEQEEIISQIKSVRSLRHGTWEIDLGSAGIWRTTEAFPSPKTPKLGDTVKIRAGMLGGYFITVGNGRTV
jgi:hypothetical protein